MGRRLAKHRRPNIHGVFGGASPSGLAGSSNAKAPSKPSCCSPTISSECEVTEGFWLEGEWLLAGPVPVEVGTLTHLLSVEKSTLM